MFPCTFRTVWGLTYLSRSIAEKCKIVTLTMHDIESRAHRYSCVLTLSTNTCQFVQFQPYVDPMYNSSITSSAVETFIRL
jgi:hypothetical protein